MDITAYFRIVSAEDHLVHVEHHGFWSDEVAQQIGEAVVADFRRTAKRMSRNGPFVVLADLSDVGVLSKTARGVLSRLMACAKEHHVYKAVEVVPHAITRLSLREAADMAGDNTFRIVTPSMEEALPVVETLKQEIPTTEPVKTT